MDEQHAIELCVKHRDPVGFEFLVQKYRREAYRHAFALLGNVEDALDACQDAFAKAFAAIPGLKDLPQFYPWFYCILRNRCFNLLARRQTSERYRAIEQENQTAATGAPSPAQLIEQREDKQRVWDALGMLTPEQREILGMKYVLGQSYDEIARTLGIPRGTVMSRLYHARMAFREAFMNLEEAPNTAQRARSQKI